MEHENLSNPVGFKSKGDMFAHFESIFNAVVSKYVHTRQLSPIIAYQIDPEPITPAQKLTVEGIHFCADVERATETALANRLDLQTAWHSMAEGHHVAPALANEVTLRCGRLYAGRKLAPWVYFRRDKYAHRTQVSR